MTTPAPPGPDRRLHRDLLQALQPLKGRHMPIDTTLPDVVGNTHILRWSAIILLAALGYTVATVGMKFAALGQYPVATALVVAGFVLATVTEIVLLRRGDLTVVYITIIGVETLMILTAAALFGEVVDLRRMIGAGCVVIGIALCSS